MIKMKNPMCYCDNTYVINLHFGFCVGGFFFKLPLSIAEVSHKKLRYKYAAVSAAFC